MNPCSHPSLCQQSSPVQSRKVFLAHTGPQALFECIWIRIFLLSALSFHMMSTNHEEWSFLLDVTLASSFWAAGHRASQGSERVFSTLFHKYQFTFTHDWLLLVYLTGQGDYCHPFHQNCHGMVNFAPLFPSHMAVPSLAFKLATSLFWESSPHENLSSR